MIQSWKLGLASLLVISGAIATGYCALALNTPVVKAKPIVLQPPVAESNNVLQLRSLRCDSTAAGGTNPDQISLFIENNRVWGPAIMNAGMIADLAAVPGIDFHKKVRVELRDQSKSLDWQHIPSTGGGTLQFMVGSANYTLTYQVVAKP
jgi:hypothetical protein